MKKLLALTVIATTLLCLQSSAQLQKGEKMLGATLGFGKVKLKQFNAFSSLQDESTSFTITPEFGVGLGNNWIAGVGVGYAYSKQKSSPSVFQIVKGINTGAFVRKFQPIGDGKFGIFGQGNVEYAHYKNESQGSANYKSTSNAISASIQPGGYVRASKRFIVEANIGSIGYSHTTSKPDDNAGDWKTTVNAFNFSLTNNLSLGFKVVL